MSKLKPDKEFIYRTSSGLNLPMFVFEPKIKRKESAAVIAIHGGGWQTGIKNNEQWDGNMMSRHAAYYAEKGFLGISFSYRSIELPGVELTDIIEDCKEAMRFIATKYDYIKKKIVIGDSAGAYLAVELGLSDDDSIRPNLVVACNPVIDFTEKFTYVAEKEETRKKLTLLNYHINKAAKMLFIHGTADSVVPFEDSSKMVKKLKENGFDAELIILENVGHAFVLFDYKNTDEQVLKYMSIMDEFIERGYEK